MRLKVKTGMTRLDAMQWHRHFCLIPRKMVSGETVWMEWVERCASVASWDGYGGIIWRYRLVGGEALSDLERLGIDVNSKDDLGRLPGIGGW